MILENYAESFSLADSRPRDQVIRFIGYTFDFDSFLTEHRKIHTLLALYLSQTISSLFYKKVSVSLKIETEILNNKKSDQTEGILVIDDSTLDKPYARKMELVTRHWSGKHHVVNLITLLWTDGDWHIPVDCRIFDKKQGALTKNDHFQSMLKEAHRRGFAPGCVAFDSWSFGL
jgi:hypothetical protein